VFGHAPSPQTWWKRLEATGRYVQTHCLWQAPLPSLVSWLPFLMLASTSSREGGAKVHLLAAPRRARRCLGARGECWMTGIGLGAGLANLLVL